MLTTSMISCIEERIEPSEVNVNGGAITICCYLYPLVTTLPRPILRPDRKLAFEAMTLFMRIERELKEARADWNQDRFLLATRLRGEKVHELDIMQLLGHSSLGVTAGYAHGTPAVIQSAVDKLAEPRGQVVEFAQRAG